MRSRPLSRWLMLAALGVVALAWAGSERDASGSGAAAVEIARVSGTLEVTNSQSGQAIFQATGLAPGRSATGTIQLSNTGSLAGELGLSQLDVQDVPGSNGGRLSHAVQLSVQDITGGSSIPVFSGQLTGLGSQPLGSIAPGEARTYRFTAALPDAGAPASPSGGDNAYAGSGLTVKYAWTATAPDEGGGTVGGGETLGSGANPVAPIVKFTVNSKNLLKRGALDVMTTCDVACRLTTYATLPKAEGARKAAKTATRTALINAPGQSARIRINVSRQSKRALVKALRTKPRVVLGLHLAARPAQGGPSRSYARKVSVSRPKRRR